jgi:hypothetical protein
VLGSIPPAGAFVGSLSAGPLMQLLGRRRILMLSSPIWVLGWSLIALAQNYEMMLYSRMLTGFCIGLVTPSAAVYVSCNFVIVYMIYVSCKFVVFSRSSNFNSCCMIYDIYMSTTIGLTSGGSSTVNIYAWTINRTTQITTEQHINN